MPGWSVRVLILSAVVAIAASEGRSQVPTAPPPAAPASMQGGPLRPFAIFRLDPAFDRILAPGTSLETIATIPGAKGEGPLWRKGRLQFSDQKGGAIYEVKLDGTYRVLLEMAGGPMDPNAGVDQGPNGQAPWKQGSVVFTRNGHRDIARMDRNGKVTSLVATWEGKRFNSPNDLVVGRDGTVWFSDPPYGLPGGNRPPAPGEPPPDKQIPFNGVFRFKDGKVTPVITDMDRPNGIGLSPDGRTLYVSNTRPFYMRAYTIGRDGTLANMREVIRFPEDHSYGRGAFDGLKIDSQGNIWTTGPGGLWILAPDGKPLGRIQMPAFASNLAFGGDYKSLFLTSGPDIYRIRTLVKGQVPAFTEK
jgi:gluconolactonase